MGSRIFKGEAQRRRAGRTGHFPHDFFCMRKKNARLAGPASLHTSFPSPPTDKSSAPSTCFASRAGTAHAKLVRGIHPLARRTLQTMLQRMLFQQFRSFTSKDQTNALSSFNVYLRTVQECFGGHSLQLYLRGRETLSKPAPDDAFSSRTAAYPVVSLTRGFDSLANGVPPSKVDAGVKSRIACQVRGEQSWSCFCAGFLCALDCARNRADATFSDNRCALGHS